MREIRDIFKRTLLLRCERNHGKAAPSPLDSVLQAIIGRAAQHRV